MQPLLDTLIRTPVVYATRDLDRALGLSLDTPGYFIIANSDSNAKQIADDRKNILLIEADGQLDTWELLERPETSRFINELGVLSLEFKILVFKPSKKIEQICARNNWPLINPPAELAGKIEEKITQLSFLPELKDLFPDYIITTLSEINNQQLTISDQKSQIKKKFEICNLKFEIPFVLQFNHSHTGVGTHLIEDEEQLNTLKQKFPHREVRITNFIDGPIFTNNNIVTNVGILVGNISYQITGLKPYTDNPFATVGNDWCIVKKLLTPNQIEQYHNIAMRVGETLREKGWKGLFGIDVILDKTTSKLYLLEINARQPQSATYESKLQQKSEIRNQKSKITTFEAHLAALLDIDLTGSALIPIDDGSQIIDRRTNEWHRSLKEPNGARPKDLSQITQQVIDDYLHLPFAQHIHCPYFNNRRLAARGNLGVMVGKGAPNEIVEEVKILALKERVDLQTLTAASLRQFLIDHGLGIECSGFVYQVLDAELKARGKGSLEEHLKWPHRNFLRRLIARLRPAENTSVSVLADYANSIAVSLADVQPGDMIIFLNAGVKHDLDHVLLVEIVQYFNTTTLQHNNTTLNLQSEICSLKLNYVHSFAWRSDGKYNHGVRRGHIEIIDTSKPLVQQRWVENGKKDEENETLGHAKTAESVGVRRLKALL